MPSQHQRLSVLCDIAEAVGDVPMGPWTSVVLNQNVARQCHIDGDEPREGVAVALSLQGVADDPTVPVSGGDWLFPTLRIHIRVRPGSLSFFDSSRLEHCNSPVNGGLVLHSDLQLESKGKGKATASEISR